MGRETALTSEMTPDDVTEALAAAPAAKVAFERLAPSHRREYLLWIDEAKKPETRARRVAGMIRKLDPAGTNEHHGKA